MSMPVPVLPRPGLPNRITPLLVPRLSGYLARVKVEVEAYNEHPAATLAAKLISGSTDSLGRYHEYYVLMTSGDPEAFLDLMMTETGCNGEVSRSCAAPLNIYVDDVKVKNFPKDSDIGYHSWKFEEATE